LTRKGPREGKTAPGFRLDLDRGPGWLRAAVLPLGLVLGVILLFPGPALKGQSFNVPDETAGWNFRRGMERLEERSDEQPLWNPYIFSGMPSHASLSSPEAIYPPGEIIGTLKALFGGPRLLWLLAHYFLAGLGLALLLRVWGVRTLFALLGGLLFMALPHYVALGANGHGSKAMSIAYLPWVLLCADRLTRESGRLLFTVLLGTVLGFQLLRAHPQIAYYALMMLGFHTLFYGYVWVVRERRPGRLGLHVLCLAGAGALAFCLGAAVYLPFMEYVPYSSRGAAAAGGGASADPYLYATAWSLHPKEMLTFLWPWSYGFGKATYFGEMTFTDYPNYLGILNLLLVVPALLWKRDRRTWFLVSIALLATAVSFGRHLPVLYRPLYEVLPYFRKFRVPVMILILQQLAVVILAMRGAEELYRRVGSGGEEARRIGTRAAAAAAAYLILAVLLASVMEGSFRQGVLGSLLERNVQGRAAESITIEAVRHFKASMLQSGVLVALAGGLVLAAGRRFLPGGALVAGLGVLCFYDLYSVDRSIVRPESLPGKPPSILVDSREWESRGEPNQVVEFLLERPGRFRILPLGRDLFSSDEWMGFGIESLGGYHAAKLKIYDDFVRRMNEALQAGAWGPFHMLNARYLVVPGRLTDFEFLEPVFTFRDRLVVYENHAAMPRAWLVGNYRVAPGEEALDAVLSSGFEPDSLAYLSRPPSVEPGPTEGGRVEMRSHTPNRIVLETSCPQPALLVLSEVHYPAWKARVDGRDREILRADYLLRALALEEGNHEVVFEFDSTVHDWGSAISRIALAAAAAFFLATGAMRLRRHRTGGRRSGGAKA
jgi:hypothetical protein